MSKVHILSGPHLTFIRTRRICRSSSLWFQPAGVRTAFSLQRTVKLATRQAPTRIPSRLMGIEVRESRQGRCPVHTKAGLSNDSQVDLPNASAALSGRCPVDHTSLSSAQPQPATNGKCPVDHAAMQATPERCPVDHQAMQAATAGEQGGQAAVCPFGFGSVDAQGNSSNKTSLHCSKCHALFHDAVTTNCGHMFCRACISPSSSCLTCGSDATELTSETYIQGLVDMFISEHTSDSFLQQHKKDEESVNKSLGTMRAEFYLQIALQSMRGQNFQAASARLQQCKDTLMSLPSEERDSAGCKIQLGTVCGSQGDCSAQMGDARQAVHYYEASQQYLEVGGADSLEAQQALTVTQNKMGDLWYRLGNLESARGLYKEALNRRKIICESNPSDMTAQIDYALSLAKVADIEQAMDDLQQAEAHLSEAKSLAIHISQLPDSLQNVRLQGLAAYLDLQLH